MMYWVLATGHTLFLVLFIASFNCHTTLSRCCYYSHITGEETEVREVKRAARGHADGEWWSQDLKPCSGSRVTLNSPHGHLHVYIWGDQDDRSECFLIQIYCSVNVDNQLGGEDTKNGKRKDIRRLLLYPKEAWTKAVAGVIGKKQ